MKILELNTGLFPDAQTVSAALRQLAPAHAVESIDVSACPRRQDLDEEAWGRVVAAILSSDLTITI